MLIFEAETIGQFDNSTIQQFDNLEIWTFDDLVIAKACMNASEMLNRVVVVQVCYPKQVRNRRNRRIIVQ